MPGVAAAAIKFFTAVGTTLGAGVGVTLAAGTALWVGVGVTAFSLLTAAKARSRVKDSAELNRQASHQVMQRNQLHPWQIVYGETLVGGPVTFMNSGGTENRRLFFYLAHTCHEIESYVGWYIDEQYVDATDVDDVEDSGDGSVDGDTASTGHQFSPHSGTPVLYLRGHKGAADQTYDVDGPADITEDHRARGCAYTAAYCQLIDGNDAWSQGGAPQNIAAVLRGKKVYDPRLDSTFTGAVYGAGSGSHRLNDQTTWAWSDNPALCTADYLILAKANGGPGFNSARINYDSVAVSADYCDEMVDVPTAATEKRFTCNGVLSAADEYGVNIEKLLSSMGGRLRLFRGLWHIESTGYRAPDTGLSETDLIGPVAWRKEPEQADRYNTVKGSFYDPARNYKLSPFIKVKDQVLIDDRDQGEELPKELTLEMTNGEFMCQRLAFIELAKANQSGVLMFPVGYKGVRYRAGDFLPISHSELGWTNKSFRVVGMNSVDFRGAELTLREDVEATYDDPAEEDYGTRSAAGVIAFAKAPFRVRTPDIEIEAVTEIYAEFDAGPYGRSNIL